MNDTEIFDPKKANKELLEFYYLMPNFNFEALEKGEYNSALDHYFKLATKLAEAEPSPLAHYTLATLHCIGGKTPYHDMKKAETERLKAGYLGHGTAMYDYGRQVKYATDESLAFLKILTDNNAGVAGIREEFEYLINKKSGAEKDRIEKLADEIMSNIKSKGLKFQFD